MENQFVAYQWGYDYGVGVNSASGGRMQQGVVGAPVPVTGAAGGSGTFQITSLELTSDLEDHLGISADASGGVGLFSGSDRFKFSKDCRIQSSSIFLLISCTKQNGFTQIDHPQLDDDAAKLVAQGNSSLFAERYGDCFVAGLQTGGRFWGVLRIDVRTEADRQTIDNSLSGSYGPFSADVQVNLTSALARTQSSANAYMYYEGGNVDKKPITPQELFQAADEWSQSVSSAPQPYAALLMPWIVADGPSPPNAADLEHQLGVLKTCARLRSQTQDRLNLLEYIMDPQNSGAFVMGPNDLERLPKLHALVVGDYDLIMEAASFAMENAKDALEPETFARTNKGLAGYALTLLPPDLPKQKPGAPTVMPNFVGMPLLSAWSIAKALGIGMSAQFTPGACSDLSSLSIESMNFIQQQNPESGTPIVAGSTVHVTGVGIGGIPTN